jgi:hypothetical protein
MSPDDHFLTNRKQSLIRSKQTPNPSVLFLVNMQTTAIFNADEQLRIGSCYFLSPSEIQNRCQRRSKFSLKPYVKQHVHGLLEKTLNRI